MLSLVETNSVPKIFSYKETDLMRSFDELDNSIEAKAYLNRRFGGFFPKFLLGFDPVKNAIVIPNIDSNQKLRGVKYRYINEDMDSRFTAEPGSFSGFYFLNSKVNSLLICEGEFDALSAKVMGFKGKIIALQTNRVTSNAKAELEILLNEAEKIYVCPDRDEAGKELLETLKSLKFQHGKIAPIIPPADFKDLSAFLEGTGIAEARTAFDGLLLGSKTEMESLNKNLLEHLDKTIEFLTNPIVRNGFDTGINILNKKLGGGLMPHTLTALSAPGKTGKTTFIIQLIANLLRNGVKVGFITLEMDPLNHVAPNLYSILLGRSIRKMNFEDIKTEIPAQKGGLLKPVENLVVMDRYGITSADLIDEWIRFNAARGVQCFFFDHVGYSLNDISDNKEHSNLSKKLRAIARELPINLMVVVQPKHLPQGQKHVTKHDLYGSVTWNQDINELLTLERGEGMKSLLRLTDSHNPLAETGDDAIQLNYDRDSCALSE